MQNSKLLEVKNLSTHFLTQDGTAKVVQNVNFAIEKGKTFALVGESGCGKSVTALSILRLVPEPQGKIVSGSVLLDGQDLTKLSEKRMRDIRGNKIAMIFQEPMTSLNPVYSVGNQIAEAVKQHQRKSARQAWADAVETLNKVGIADPVHRARDPISQKMAKWEPAKMYPHQLSGGMQQRIMIAMAVSCKPALLIADEPTTALDVTIQEQILDLLDKLQEQSGMSILLIMHDLGVVAERAEEVAVMYASRIVELADSQRLFAEPYHPYTRGLLQSRCTSGLGLSAKRLQTIPGTVPQPLHFPNGCKFHPRCRTGCNDNRCQTVEPALRQVQPGRWVACWYAKDQL